MTKNARPRHAAQSRVSRIAGRAALGVLGAPMAMLAIAGPAGAAEADLTNPLSDDEAAGATDAGFDASALPGLAAAELSAFPTDGLPDGLDLQGIDLGLLNLGGGGAGLSELPSAGGPDLSVLELTQPVSYALPSTDALPALPALPSLPGTDALPSLPGTDSLPSLPIVSDLPALPELPVVADLPTLPTDDVLAALPSTDVVTDALPELPVSVDLPELPELPELPVVGELPALPALPVLSSTSSTGDEASTDDEDVDDATENLRAALEVNLSDLPDASAVTDAVPGGADVFSAADLVSGLI
jgi:hypothetical protein